MFLEAFLVMVVIMITQILINAMIIMRLQTVCLLYSFVVNVLNFFKFSLQGRNKKETYTFVF